MGNFPPSAGPSGTASIETTSASFWKSADEHALPTSWRPGSPAARRTCYQTIDGRKPYASIGELHHLRTTASTLQDLVSYNEKHNEANGEDNRDGAQRTTVSWNCGVEGETDDTEILALRERQKRNILTTLFASQGLPMLLAGDEFGRTQNGNNNAYCQDNPIGWVDWSRLAGPDEAQKPGDALYAFTQRLARLRHDYPILRRERFLTGHYNEELDVKDVTWLRPDGKEMQDADWTDGNAHSLAVLLDDAARSRPASRSAAATRRCCSASTPTTTWSASS